jgi:uncharacterized membrane protein YhhN
MLPNMDWGTLLGIVGVIGIPASVGLTMAATTPGEFQFIRGCFVLSAALATGAIFLSQWNTGFLSPARLAITAVLGAVVFAGMAIALDWVQKKEGAA